MKELNVNNFTYRHGLISFLQDINIIGVRAIALMLPKLILPQPKGKLIMETIHGFVMEIDPVKDIGVERSIYYTGTYEKGTLFIIESILKAGDTFVDIGANIGLMSIFASSVVKSKGKVFSFEPNPATAEILSKNIKLNNISNIVTSNYAIGSKEEVTKIYDRWDVSRGGASLIKPENETGSYEINVIRLIDYFDDNKQEIQLIKIDVEGYEFEALKGAENILKREKPPMLIIECSEMRENSDGFTKGTLFEYIKGINQYAIFKSVGSKGRSSKLAEITKKSEMPDHDNVYCFTKQHLQAIKVDIFR